MLLAKTLPRSGILDRASEHLSGKSLFKTIVRCVLAMAASIYYARENHETIFLFKDIAFAVRAKMNSFKGFKRSL